MKALAILILVLCPVAHAQETTDATRRQKAIELLQSLATQISTLQSPENRARIGANIADSLWAHDQKRARALFISIEDDINLGLRGRETKNSSDDYTSMVFMQLRTDTVTRIAKYDGELALDFLRATAPTSEKKLPETIAARERDFEVKLAAQLAQNNPELALKIGRQSLSRGFSEHLLLLLKRLNSKHKEQGVALYKDTVRALRDADFSHHRPALTFARSLAAFLTPPSADEPAFRDFIELWRSTAVANGCGKPNVADESADFCEEANYLMRKMQLDPLHPAPLRRRTEDDNVVYEFTDYGSQDLQDELETADLDELRELVKKNPEMERIIYLHAAMAAQENGEFERAQKIANDLTGNPELRQQLLDQLKANDDAISITDEQMERIPLALNKIEQVEDQIGFLADLANRVGRKNHPAAVKLLDQAATLIESLKPGKDRMSMQLSLALLFCTEKSDRGLALIESLIPKLNEMIDAAAKLDGFDTHYLREGEWNMSANGPLGEILTYLSENATYFAWTDFDRAVNLAAQFERAEIRMMAQAKLAQSILGGPPKRFKLTRGLGY